MRLTTALILEGSDFTKDGNLKREAFDAFAKSDLVVNEGRVIKVGATLVSQAIQEPVKRVRRVQREKLFGCRTVSNPTVENSGETSTPSDS